MVCDAMLELDLTGLNNADRIRAPAMKRLSVADAQSKAKLTL